MFTHIWRGRRGSANDCQMIGSLPRCHKYFVVVFYLYFIFRILKKNVYNKIYKIHTRKYKRIWLTDESCIFNNVKQSFRCSHISNNIADYFKPQPLDWLFVEWPKTIRANMWMFFACSFCNIVVKKKFYR